MLNKKITKRDELLSVRFSRKELDNLEQVVEDEGTRVATWIRIVVLKEMRNRKR